MIKTYLSQHIPDCFSKSVLNIGNKIKLFFTLFISIALSILLLFGYEIPCREFELNILPLSSDTIQNLYTDIDIVINSGGDRFNKNTDKHGSIIRCSYSLGNIINNFNSTHEVYINGDTSEFKLWELKSFFEKEQIQKKDTFKYIRHLLYINYRERELPHLFYHGDNSPEPICTQDYCNRSEFSLININNSNYLQYKAIIAALDSTISAVCAPTSDAMHNIKWWYPYDISQTFVHLTLGPHCTCIDSMTISFTFSGGADVSQMSPSPDCISMNTIHFNKQEKIAQIKKDGLLFYAEFPHMTNLQIIRMFALTTLLGFFIALTANYLKNIIIRYARKRISDKNKT